MMIELMIARGRSLAGLRASPASWVACSKPSSENTMPPPGIAIRIDLTAEPLTKKPPPALRLPPCDLKTSSTMMVSTGTRIFQVVRMLLTRASQPMPIRLTRREDEHQDDRDDDPAPGQLAGCPEL